jgi:hypothetical protein
LCARLRSPRALILVHVAGGCGRRVLSVGAGAEVGRVASIWRTIRCCAPPHNAPFAQADVVLEPRGYVRRLRNVRECLLNQFAWDARSFKELTTCPTNRFDQWYCPQVLPDQQCDRTVWF